MLQDLAHLFLTFFLQYLDCLWSQIQKLKKDRWQERHILRPYLAFDSILCEALQHNLPPFTPPPHTEDSVYPMPRVIFRMFDYTDDPEVCNFTSRFLGQCWLKCAVKLLWNKLMRNWCLSKIYRSQQFTSSSGHQQIYKWKKRRN